MPKSEAIPMRRLWVRWNDASHSGGWHVLKDARRDKHIGQNIVCESLGFEIKRTKKYLVIAQSANDCGDISDLLIIPIRMIECERELTPF